MADKELIENMPHSVKVKIIEELKKDRLEQVNRSCETIEFKESIYTKYIKRLFDIAISSIAVVATLPINLLIGVITFFDVGRPVFFKQERLGKNKEVFTIIKFRNMKNTTDKNGELLPASKRVTRWGRIVRKTSLDELMNFWSVLKGDMSVIGPRPLVTATADRFSQRHQARFFVKPGLECPPRNKISDVRTWHTQFENDVWYVQNVSFKTDCMMLFNLIRFTCDRRNSGIRGSADRGTFMGYTMQGEAIDQYHIPEEYLKKYYEGEKQ